MELDDNKNIEDMAIVNTSKVNLNVSLGSKLSEFQKNIDLRNCIMTEK